MLQIFKFGPLDPDSETPRSLQNGNSRERWCFQTESMEGKQSPTNIHRALGRLAAVAYTSSRSDYSYAASVVNNTSDAIKRAASGAVPASAGRAGCELCAEVGDGVKG
jgi:hypothetical protein